MPIDDSAPGPAAPDAVVVWTRRVAIGSTLALFVLCVAWEAWLAPTGRGTLALKALPLLAPLPGLARLRLYTYRWTSLLVWLYVAEGATRAASERGRGALLAAAEIGLALLLFAACVVHVRWRLQHGARRAAAA
jgi:uncharacterized membrane protein